MVALVGRRRYRLGAEIATSRSGKVHRGADCAAGTEVAIKVEPPGECSPRLPREAAVYMALEGVRGVPRLHWSGSEGGVGVLVTERMGPTLERVFRAHGRSLRRAQVVDTALQVVNILELIHARGYVHRDVRPEKFLLGRGLCTDQVHLVGLSVAKRFRDAAGKRHIPYRESSSKVATWNPVFASVNAHMGRESSRRDDLESAGYMIAYLFRGDLPWQAAAPSGAGVHAGILRSKLRASVEELCEGCPPQLAEFISCCRGLRFEQRPDYAHLRSLLQGMGRRAHEGRRSDPLAYRFERDWTFRPVARRSDSMVQASAAH